MENTIKKIWGKRQRLLKTLQAEIDLLHLDKDSACSVHSHENKINRFILLQGDVRVKTDLGEVKLKINEPFDVEPPLKHQFVVKENSLLLEIAYVTEGEIDVNDIERVVQGGKFVDGKFYTLDSLKENNWKEYEGL